MRFSQSRSYINSNPRFALTTASRPKLSRGQMTIVYESLEPYRKEYSLEELVRRCIARNYEETFEGRNTDIRKSIIYHLNRIKSVRQAN